MRVRNRSSNRTPLRLGLGRRIRRIGYACLPVEVLPHLPPVSLRGFLVVDRHRPENLRYGVLFPVGGIPAKYEASE